MFRKSRVKIITAIVSVLLILFLGTVSLIYGVSYAQVTRTNDDKLARYIELYTLEQKPTMGALEMDASEGQLPEIDGELPDEIRRFPRDEDSYQLATFYSVAVSENGEILAIDTGTSGIYDEEMLTEYAEAILAQGKTHGVKKELRYQVSDRENYKLVAFIDNTVLSQSMSTLLHYTLIFGTATVLSLFLLAIYLAGRIVAPLEESYQKQKQFVSDAGHELKTPIAVVNANAELLARELGDNPWLANIQYENEHMGRLVEQLLDLARTEQLQSKYDAVNFSQLAEGEALALESYAFEQGIQMQTTIAEHVTVQGNATQLRQLVTILADNAIRHSTEGAAKIRIDLMQQKGNAVFTVVNAGEEIPEEQRKHLFDRFYRIDQVRGGEEKHYGLGLAIAKAIVQSHNGKITVRCRNKEVEFCVVIPIKNKK